MNSTETPDQTIITLKEGLYKHLSDILKTRELEGKGRFVSIGGTSIDVDDLMDTLHGKPTDPILTEFEITTTATHGKEHKGASDLYFEVYYGPQSSHRRLAISRLKAARDAKRGHIERLIKAYKSNPKAQNIPRREAIVAALAGTNKACFNNLTEFIARTAQLDSNTAHYAFEASKEVSPQEGYSRAINGNTVGKISESTAQLIADLLGLELLTVSAMPMLVLEKATFGHNFKEDDAHQLYMAGNPEPIPIPSQSWDLIAVFGTYIGGFTGIGGALAAAELSPPEYKIQAAMIALTTGLSISVGSIGYAALSRFTGISFRNLVRKNRYQKAVTEGVERLLSASTLLDERIQKLEESPLGRIKKATLRETVLQLNGCNKKDEELIQSLLEFIEELMASADLLSEFNDFWRLKSSSEFETSSTLVKLIQDFRLYKKARTELESPFALNLSN